MEKNKEKERMLELLESFNNAKENIKEPKREYDKKVLSDEKDRMRKLAAGKINENFYTPGGFYPGGRGQTVNSLPQGQEGYTDSNLKSKPQASALQADEALEVSLKRTLKSGAPINNITFYDEVNWNLMNLGFPAKNEIDIKTALLNLIKD